MPRRQGNWRVLGGHRRALSLHPVRHLPVRRAVAAGRRLSAVRGPVRGKHTTNLVELAAARHVALRAGRCDRADARRLRQTLVRPERILGRAAARVPPVHGRIRRRLSNSRRARAGATLGAARDQRSEHRLHRAGARRTGDHPALHGQAASSSGWRSRDRSA